MHLLSSEGKVLDIYYGESCCGEHMLNAEVFNKTGEGFAIKKSPETGVATVVKYAKDKMSILDTAEFDSDEALLEYINK